MKRKLELENAHERDRCINFDEPTHTYTLDGEKLKGSVSSFWAQFFDHFEPGPVIARCFRKWQANRDERYGYLVTYLVLVEGATEWGAVVGSVSALVGHDVGPSLPCASESESGGSEGDKLRRTFAEHERALNDKGYYWLIQYLRVKQRLDDGAIKTEIANLWTSIGNRASRDGTYMHLQLELRNNGEEFDREIKEVRLYEAFARDYPWMTPYRTEWSVYSRDVRLAGQIDLVMKDARPSASGKDRYFIVDFKRCRDALTPDNPYQKFGKAPFHTVPDTPYGHYSVQQAVYRWFLERIYGITIEKCYLLQLHPSQDHYRLVDLPDLRDEVQAAMKRRRSEIRLNN